MQHPSSSTLLGVLAFLALQPQATTAFTASCIGGQRRLATRLTALQQQQQVDDDSVAAAATAVVNDKQEEESSHGGGGDDDDLFVVKDLEQQHLSWEVDMEAIHSQLYQQVDDVPMEEKEDTTTIDETTTTTAPAEELVMKVQEVAAPSTPSTTTAEPVSSSTKDEDKDTVILPVESTSLRAESELKSLLCFTNKNEPLLELSGAATTTTTTGNTDMLAHLTAKLATAQRVIATVAKENQDMKQERAGLFAASSSPAAKRPFRRLVGMLSRNNNNNKAKNDDDDDTMMLSEVTHDAIEIDSVLRLSILIATAQRTMQTLLQENRDLKFGSYYGASSTRSGISLVPAQGPEEIVTAASEQDNGN